MREREARGEREREREKGEVRERSEKWNRYREEFKKCKLKLREVYSYYFAHQLP